MSDQRGDEPRPANDTQIEQMSAPRRPSDRGGYGGQTGPGGQPGQGGPGTDPRMPATRPLGCGSWLLFMAAMFLINYLIVNLFFPAPTAPVEIPYNVFRQQAEAGNVVSVATKADTMYGDFETPITLPLPPEVDPSAVEPITIERFSTTLPSFLDPGLETLLLENDVEINAETLQEVRSPLLTFLFSFGPALLMIGLFIWLSRRMTSAGGGMGGIGNMFGMGKSKAKRYDESEEKVTFDDVAGIDEAEHELVEIVDFLKNPDKYTRLGGTAPKGVLLVGQPGTGKTLLAKAVAGEAGVPFFSMNASEFVEMIVGVGASRVRDLFKDAREAAPSIIFIDELDAIGRKRGQNVYGGGSSEQEQTLNQILTEMDGFSTKEGVIVLAATNMPEVLDAALLRAGRFDRRVTVQPPDKIGRKAILEVHTREVPLGPDVDLMAIASMTPGLVGADLRNLVNEAAILAARKGQDQINQRDFADSLEKIILGPERKLLLKREDRERVAYHEAGHAILGLVVPGADPVSRVTITPRGQSLGVTYQRPEDDRYNYSEAYLRGRIVGALGGRAAEEIVYGDRTTGAENDLQHVTRMAQGMVTRWGMSEAIGPVSLAAEGGQYLGGQQTGVSQGFSQATLERVDQATRQIIEECYQEALDLLNKHRDELEKLAAALMEQESLDEQEVLDATGIPSQVDHSDRPQLAPEGAR